MSDSRPAVPREPQSFDGHTSGPWRLLPGQWARKTSNFDSTRRLAVLAGPEGVRSNTVAYAIGETAEECRANAAVIAAAPDLLAQRDEALAAASRWEARAQALQQRELDNHHNALTCPYCNPQGLKLAADQRETWQPIDMLPATERDTVLLYWVVPKTAAEAFVNTANDPIFGTFEPFIHKGRYGSWSSLSKATHFHRLPAPPPPPQEPTS